MLSESTLCDRFQFTLLSLPMKNMVPFNSADHSISQGYAWACRGTTIKVGKMQLQTISNMYLSVESLAMIKGLVNSFLQERKVFLQRHQISLCHDKLPAPLAKRLRWKKRECFGPWKCTKRITTHKLLTRVGIPSHDIEATVFSLSQTRIHHTRLAWTSDCAHSQRFSPVLQLRMYEKNYISVVGQ